MKMKRIIKEEKGAALPIITLLMVFLLFGIASLVVDAGLAYSERRVMVTAADASALAGARVIQEAFGSAKYETEVDINTAKAEAEKVAVNLALANGVKNSGDIQISWDNIIYLGKERDVITVRVKNNKKLIFARLLGFDDADVAAKAVATWGYTLELEGGNILPIFAKQSLYDAGGIIYLHNGKLINDAGDVTKGNWGLLNIFENAGAIAGAFEGINMDERMKIDSVLENKTGQVIGNIIVPIEERMKTADGIENPEDRHTYMCGLIPIISNIKVVNGSQLDLPVTVFAVFEIYDIITDEGKKKNGYISMGSEWALYNESFETTQNDSYYVCDNSKMSYDPIEEDANNNGTIEEDEIKALEKSTIIGKFTNETVEVRAIVNPDDQTNPKPGVISLTYSKLIE